MRVKWVQCCKLCGTKRPEGRRPPFRVLNRSERSQINAEMMKEEEEVK